MEVAIPRNEMNQFVYSSAEIEMSDTVLGRGAFGEVRIAKWRNIKVAAKFLHTDDDSNEQSLDLELRKEVEVLTQLRHPNLVLFIGICEDSSRDRIGWVILTELLPCSLYDLLEGKPSEGIEKITMELPDIIDIALDVGNALNYLHRHEPSIVHRDISSKNILIDTNRKAKVADLGQAKIFAAQSSSYPGQQSRQTSMPGAMAYSAPEVLTGKYSEKIDIFSFGVLLTQMCCGEYPRIDRREEQTAAAVRAFPILKSLIAGTTQYQPSERPSAFFLCETLDLLKSNDRYYPNSRRVAPEKDIGILARHWIRKQIDAQTKDSKLALEQTSRRLIAEEHRWRTEATRVDELTQQLKVAETESKSREERMHKLEYDMASAQQKASQISRANDSLNELLRATTEDKQQLAAILAQTKQGAAETGKSLEEANAIAQQYFDEAQINAQLLDASREAEEEGRQRGGSLEMQLKMQVELSRDLEARLEQALSRWKHDKDLCGKETARCAKLSATCSVLIEKNNKLEADAQRTEVRLRGYDSLPMPEEIKQRMADMRSDMARASQELQKLVAVKDELAERNRALEASVAQKQSQNEQLEAEAQKQTQALAEQQAEITDYAAKLKSTQAALDEKEGSSISMQLELSRARETERRLEEEKKSLKTELLREAHQVTHLRRMQGIGGGGGGGGGSAGVFGGGSDPSAPAEAEPGDDGPDSGSSSSSSWGNESGAMRNPGADHYKQYKSNQVAAERPSDLAIKTLVTNTLEYDPGVSRILTLMMDMKDDDRVAWRGCRAIREIVVKSEEDRMLCYREKIEELLVFYLINFAHVSVVQSNCIRLVGTLAFGNDLFRRKMGEKGVMQCLVNAMTVHGGDETVQLHVCTTITNLTHNSLENRSRFFEQGGVEVLVQLMGAFQQSAKYQRQACWAILTLSGSDELSRKIATSGGDSAIMNAMLHHRADPGVQQFGCWALANMALSGDDISRKLKKKGVVEVFKMALESHSTDAEVVRQARHAIGIFAPIGKGGAVDTGSNATSISPGKTPKP